MNYLVAVSGGVDSVVLLDKLAHEAEHEVTVAHFDHGIRSDSAADARFVEGLAGKYHFPFVGRREELGESASEELARTRRYAFLRREAHARSATLVTAHHQDDIIETIAINFVRGTGWRGLTVLSAQDVIRPLLALTKAEIREYARDKRLEWVEDSTNSSDKYLRNRIRRQVARLDASQRENLIASWARQRELRTAIETEAARLTNDEEQSRYFFTHSDDTTGLELLRAVFVRRGVTAPTRPQLERALLAIKTARTGATFEVGGGASLRFTARAFIVTAP